MYVFPIKNEFYKAVRAETGPLDKFEILASDPAYIIGI